MRHIAHLRNINNKQVWRTITEAHLKSLRYFLPLEKRMTLHLDKLESPSLKNALCRVLLKLAHFFFLNIKCQCILSISLFFPFWKGLGPPFLLHPRMKMEKFIDRQTDGWQTAGNQKSSLELSLRWATFTISEWNQLKINSYSSF